MAETESNRIFAGEYTVSLEVCFMHKGTHYLYTCTCGLMSQCWPGWATRDYLAEGHAEKHLKEVV